jgi:hypothetical protein
MQAIFSGEAGVALLVDGETLSSIHAGRTDEVIRRARRDIPYLFGGASDLELVEQVELPQVAHRLEIETAKADALQLALILLDRQLSPDTRRDAAAELKDLQQIEGVTEWVEGVLYARPLPVTADLPGAFSCCSGDAAPVRGLLRRLSARQKEIREVYCAWEQIPARVFGPDKDRQPALAAAVRGGLFRDLVLSRAAKISLDTFYLRSLVKPWWAVVRNHGRILREWLSPLSEADASPAQPGRTFVSRQQFVADAEILPTDENDEK